MLNGHNGHYYRSMWCVGLLWQSRATRAAEAHRARDSLGLNDGQWWDDAPGGRGRKRKQETDRDGDGKRRE